MGGCMRVCEGGWVYENDCEWVDEGVRGWVGL